MLVLRVMIQQVMVQNQHHTFTITPKIPGYTIILGLVLVATTDVEIELEPETAAPNSIVQNVSALSNNTTNFGSVLKLQQGEYTISEPIGLTGPKSVLLVATNGPLRILRINYI